jgi:hypothetical protein
MMAPTRPFVVFGFASTHDALAAETVLKGAGVTVVPIPSPREIGELCGIALRVPTGESDQAENMLRSAKVRWSVRIEFDDV